MFQDFQRDKESKNLDEKQSENNQLTENLKIMEINIKDSIKECENLEKIFLTIKEKLEKTD